MQSITSAMNELQRSQYENLEQAPEGWVAVDSPKPKQVERARAAGVGVVPVKTGWASSGRRWKPELTWYTTDPEALAKAAKVTKKESSARSKALKAAAAYRKANPVYTAVKRKLKADQCPAALAEGFALLAQEHAASSNAAAIQCWIFENIGDVVDNYKRGSRFRETVMMDWVGDGAKVSCLVEAADLAVGASYRHGNTDYDYLLKNGATKEEARNDIGDWGRGKTLNQLITG